MNLGIGYSLFSEFLKSDSYYCICLTAYALMLLSPFVFWKQSRRGWAYIALMVAAFAAVKLLSLYIGQRNPDEGQQVLMASSLIHGGVPFRDFEGQGLGPLNAFYIALFSFGGVSFFTERLAALAAELGSGVLIFLAARRMCGVRPAIAISCPVFYYFSFYGYTNDVVAYNCETLFCLLISLWLMLFAYRKESRLMLFAEFFVLGLLPWIKLQFAPFSVICFFIGLGRSLFVHEIAEDGSVSGLSWKSAEKGSLADFLRGTLISQNTLIACAAAAAPSLLFFALLALSAGLPSFWLLYILVNIQHVSVPLADYLEKIGPYLVSFSGMDMFWMAVCPALAFMTLALAEIRISMPRGPVSPAAVFAPVRLIAGLIHEGRRAQGAVRKALAVALLAAFVLTAVFSATRTMNLFYHYVNILLPASVIFAALGLSMVSGAEKRAGWAISVLMAAAAVFVFKLMTQVNISFTQENDFLKTESYPFRDAVEYLNQHVNQGEPVAIWGWDTGFPVYSGHPSATSTHFLYPLVDPKFSPEIQAKVREKYVDDILRIRPAAIVDLVCPAAFTYKDRQFELSNYGFIRRIADEYYEKPVSVPAGSDGSVRIYLRKKGL